MKLDVELISEMMIFEHRLVQVGSGAAQGLPCLVWRGSGFAGFGVTLEQVGSGAALGLPWLVWRGMGWRSLRTGTPPTPKIWKRGLTGLALGVSGCGGGAPYPIGGAAVWCTARAPRVYADFFSEGMMRLLRVLEQLGGMQKIISPLKTSGFSKCGSARARVWMRKKFPH